MSNVPACKDCIHFSGAHGQGGGDPECHHPKTQTFDIVGGLQPASCRAARHGECGLRGTLFKQNDHTIDELLRWLLLGGVAVVILMSGLRAMGWV